MSAQTILRQSTSKLPIVHKTIQSIRNIRKSLPSSFNIGYVPTMGALHEGHLSLVNQASKENDIVIVSIFVNPTQFGKGEDLSKYPRQLEVDVDLLSDYKVDHIFAPTSQEIYPSSKTTTATSTIIDPIGFESIPESLSRPGHFRGVATIVTKLFNIIQPSSAYFGQKDAAQCIVLRQVINDLNIPVNMVICDTLREKDGLAKSSRNVYLSPEERKASCVLYKSLCAAQTMFQNHFPSNKKSIPCDNLINTVERMLQNEPLVSTIEYISLSDRMDMTTLQNVNTQGGILSIACKIGSVRLIDNIILSL